MTEQNAMQVLATEILEKYSETLLNDNLYGHEYYKEPIKNLKSVLETIAEHGQAGLENIGGAEALEKAFHEVEIQTCFKLMGNNQSGSQFIKDFDSYLTQYKTKFDLETLTLPTENRVSQHRATIEAEDREAAQKLVNSGIVQQLYSNNKNGSEVLKNLESFANGDKTIRLPDVYKSVCELKTKALKASFEYKENDRETFLKNLPQHFTPIGQLVKCFRDIARSSVSQQLYISSAVESEVTKHY